MQEHVTPFVMRVVIMKDELGALMELLKGTLQIFEKLVQEDAFHLDENSRNMLFVWVILSQRSRGSNHPYPVNIAIWVVEISLKRTF